MQKTLCKIIILSIILMLLIPILAQATDVNMNLTANTTTQNTSTTNTSTQPTSNDSQTTTDNLSPSTTNYSNPSPTVSSLNQLPESGLGLSNVINIILIVIGVLLILLGIAILIRLKH